jgi:hypothetical protein
MTMQIDARKVTDQWSQVTVSVDTQSQLRIFCKLVYTDKAEATSAHQILIDTSITALSFVGTNMYDYIPYNMFNVQPLCGYI